jgi:hypothetical protein
LEVACSDGSSLEGGTRATCPWSSDATPGGRRWSVAKAPRDCGLLILLFIQGCFLQFGRPYLQIVGYVGRVL